MSAEHAPGARVTRRRLLAAAAVAAGGAALGAGVPPLVRSLGPGGDPLPRVPRLALARRAGGVVAGELVAAPGAATVGGDRARMLLYAGAFPGPLIDVAEGERLELRFVNRLREPSNLHLHGLHMAPAMDRPFLHLEPGEHATYRWRVEAGAAGTYWYHPHVHGRVAAQLMAGLTGPLVIRGPVDRHPALRAAEERLLVLRPTRLHDGRMLVNGAIAPRTRVRRGTVRLRLLNASTQDYARLAFEDLPLHLITTDAGMVERPVALDELLLSPGERAEVLVQLAPGEHALRRLPYARAGGATRDEAETLLTLDASGAAAATPLPRELRTVAPVDVPRDAVRRRVTFSVADTGEYLMNGRSFSHERVEFRPRPGAVEVWELINDHTADHNFHLHTWPFQVLERDGRPERLTAWRDVLNLRGGQRAAVAIPFSSFTGRTVFHCHNADHEDGGMMAIVEVGDGPAPRSSTAPSPNHDH